MADGQEKNGRLMRIVLVVSLAVNLAVAGLVVGTVVSGRLGEGPPRSFDLGLGPMARALAPEDRRAIGQALRRARPMGDYDPRAQTELMAQALRAVPFDPQALYDVIATQTQRSAQIQGAAQDAVVARITALTAGQRAALADRLLAEMSEDRPRPPRN
ncbi:Uncharacterized membrane protein [Yoonia tamlensis]|uniref:Uncharacterized membrane protein n=1 Tax=Yoonia tamlensis TaxID=390270 RepID=A0A1I6FW65_9RHOB|nr:periplasmic heavy metal sensor [Yoonia tamlensis]SFR34148.1 Uncharacterized membrane protein [Yoonia tamlensis]